MGSDGSRNEATKNPTKINNKLILGFCWNWWDGFFGINLEIYGHASLQMKYYFLYQPAYML